jgi:hypothetical protein
MSQSAKYHVFTGSFLDRITAGEAVGRIVGSGQDPRLDVFESRRVQYDETMDEKRATGKSPALDPFRGLILKRDSTCGD